MAAVGGRDEVVPCSSWLVAICIHGYRDQLCFASPPAGGEGKSCPARGGESLLFRRAGMPTGNVDVLWGNAVRISSCFGMLRGRAGGGFVLSRAG